MKWMLTISRYNPMIVRRAGLLKIFGFKIFQDLTCSIMNVLIYLLFTVSPSHFSVSPALVQWALGQCENPARLQMGALAMRCFSLS